MRGKGETAGSKKKKKNNARERTEWHRALTVIMVMPSESELVVTSGRTKSDPRCERASAVCVPAPLARDEARMTHTALSLFNTKI